MSHPLDAVLLEAAARLRPPVIPDPLTLCHEIGLSPDRWQADLLTSTADRILVNACRQAGKSTTTATLAVWMALAQSDALVLLVSPSLRQSGELFRKCVGVYGRLGRPVAADAETKLSIELVNGSRILSLPGSEATIRGYSAVDLLVIDEASRVDDELVAAVRPMLATSHGRLVALSTPFGCRGWWWQAWEQGGDDWQRVLVPASLCPRIPVAFLAAERRALTPLAYQSEYECRFVDTDDQVFASELVLRALDPEIKPFTDLPELPLAVSGDTAGHSQVWSVTDD